MTSKKIVRTAWGSKQVVVPDLPALSQEEETELRQEWETPRNFWHAINSEFEFDIDVAASEKNTLCSDFIDFKIDALSDRAKWVNPVEDRLRAYCNPGFNNMLPWIHRAAKEVSRDPRAVVCVLGLCAPSTGWWGEAVRLASEIRLLSPRVQFQAPDPRIPQSSNAREGALFIFRGDTINSIGKARIETWKWK